MDSKPEEHDCPQCNGTGKIKICPLCHGTGIISNSAPVRQGTSWVSMRCPNGCPPPIVTYSGGTNNAQT